MIYIKLFITFFKIGLFSFGGGYAMIPLIQKEIESRAWISPSEIVDIIGLAQIAPGSIAVNSATFVGYKVSGILGATIACLGCALPSLIIILLIVKFIFEDNIFTKLLFYGIRPVVAGLIVTAAILVGKTGLFKVAVSSVNIHNLIPSLNITGTVLLIVTVIAIIKYKINPIFTIIFSAAVGILVSFI